MTAIERTAYPTFARAPQPKELLTLYTPTPEDVAFVSTIARGPSQKFALMILLKVFQKLGYFPAPTLIPEAIITHIRAVMKLPEDLPCARYFATYTLQIPCRYPCSPQD